MNREYYTERLILKSLDESSVDKILAYYIKNKEFLKKREPIREDFFYTIEGQSEIIKREIEDFKTGRMFRLWIFKRDEPKRIIGNIGLTNIVRGCFHSCFLGYKLDGDEVRQGYMTEALKKVIEIAFNELNLHRIEANIMPDNWASIGVVEKAGFISEGLSKDYLYINGKWENHLRFVLINENWMI